MNTFNNNAIMTHRNNSKNSCLHSEKPGKCTHLASKNKKEFLNKKDLGEGAAKHGNRWRE